MEARARALQEEEAALASEMEDARQKIEALKNPPPATVSPPVWRAQPADPTHEPHPTEVPVPKLTTRTHRAQQKRDRNLFVLLFFLVSFVLFLLIHVWHG